MKKLLFVLVFLSIVSFSTFAQSNWNTLKSETGKFEVAIFGDVIQSLKDNEKSSLFKIQFNSNDINYLVSSSKHKSELGSEIDELLSVSISAFNEQLNGVIVNKKEVLLENVKGVYAEINLEQQGAKLEYYVYMHDVYQYQIIVVAAAESYDSAVANRFFNSFKILK